MRPSLTIGPLDDPYLLRWALFPKRWFIARWFNIYLHQMLHDDDDRALHDHPYANVSIILRGGYDKVMFAWQPQPGQPLPPRISYQRRPWHVVLRRANTAHRLMLPRSGIPCSWSLFICGPRRREWGFWCPGGRWLPWTRFKAPETYGQRTGPGCDA